MSFKEFLVTILKPENDGNLELVKSVSCNPNTAGLYHLKSRASSLKLAWKSLKFHWKRSAPSLQSGGTDYESSRHRTGQNTGWKGPDSAPPSSACLNLQAWVEPGSRRKERSAWGVQGLGPSPTLTAVGERLDDDESSFEDAFFKGPAEPLGAVLEGTLRGHFGGIGRTLRGRFGGTLGFNCL